MCLIVFAWQRHPEFPFVFAGNRDEFFARATKSAHWWGTRRQILAGRDLQAGGTWCGVTSTGRFAALTNFRGPNEKKSDAPSRGHLVSDFLEGAAEPVAYLRAMKDSKRLYNGFNLLLGEHLLGPGEPTLWIDSNRDPKTPLLLEPGIYGVSNARLDTPWPKVEIAKARLTSALDAMSPEHLVANLFELLADSTRAPDSKLPKTGVSLALERDLSAAFVRLDGYGTRASTVMVLDRGGRLRFIERSFGEAGQTGELQYEVRSEAAAPT